MAVIRPRIHPAAALAAAIVLSIGLSGCKEKSVFRRNVSSEQALAKVREAQNSVKTPELPGAPEPPPGVGREVVLETPAERFMTGIPEALRPPVPDGPPLPPGPPKPGQPFVRLFEPPQGLDASPVMRELELVKDLKLVKERELRPAKE